MVKSLWFIDGGKSCLSPDILNVANMSFNAIRENKVLTNIFGFTVYCILADLALARLVRSQWTHVPLNVLLKREFYQDLVNMLKFDQDALGFLFCIVQIHFCQ